MQRRSRRTVLHAIAGASVLPGCLSGGDGANCDAAEVVSVEHVVENAFPYDEYLRVEVAVRSDDAPSLAGELDVCEGERTVSRELSTEQSVYEFGPFGHHCPRNWEFWLSGCR